MKKTIPLIITAFFMIYTVILNAQTPSNDPNWNQSPVWHDEFNGSDVDTTCWKVHNYYDHFFYRDFNFNMDTCTAKQTDEGQLYRNRKRYHQSQGDRDEAIYNYDVYNGVLKLLLQDDDCDCPPYARTQWDCSMQYFFDQCTDSIPLYHYSGGAIVLKNDYRIKYGYIEAKVKMNCGDGFFPAFWLFGIDDASIHHGSDYQEIDIFEMTYGRQNGDLIHDQNVMTSNRHYTSDSTHKSTSFIINDYRNYHKYGLEWTPSKIIYYVDGRIYRIEKNEGIFDSKKIIFNFAVHRNEVDPSGNYFPGVMDVDYVRLYKPRTDYSTVLNMNNYNFSNHDNKVKKKIIMSGSNALQTTDHVYLRATKGVEINGDFTVPIGAELYIDVNSAY